MSRELTTVEGYPFEVMCKLSQKAAAVVAVITGGETHRQLQKHHAQGRNPFRSTLEQHLPTDILSGPCTTAGQNWSQPTLAGPAGLVERVFGHRFSGRPADIHWSSSSMAVVCASLSFP